jgi:nicotinamide mononucleotide adenylyltransferase
LKELGDVPRPFGEEERDIQLTLENRFKSNIGMNRIISQELQEINKHNLTWLMTTEETAPEESIYQETKELIIQIFKAIPIKKAAPQTLMDILKDATKYAKDSNNKTLGTFILLSSLSL